MTQRNSFDLGGITPEDTGHVPPAIHPTAVIGEPPEHRDWREKHRVLRAGVHPTARVNAFCTIDGGMYGFTTLGAYSWMLAHSHLGHDASVGVNVEICTGALIGGGCLLMHGCKIGLNATVLPKIVIGEGARVGAGSVVTKDVAAGETWAGNPARPVGDQDPDRKVTLKPGLETTVGAIQSSTQRLFEACRSMDDRPHPITRAGTGEIEKDAFGHPADRSPGPWSPADPDWLAQADARRRKKGGELYATWKKSEAGLRWFEARARIYADGGSLATPLLLGLGDRPDAKSPPSDVSLDGRLAVESYASPQNPTCDDAPLDQTTAPIHFEGDSAGRYGAPI